MTPEVERTRSRWLIAVIVLGAVVAVLLVVGLLVGGAPSSGGRDTVVRPLTETRVSDLPAILAADDVELRAGSSAQASPVVDRLSTGDVLHVRVTDLAPNTRGQVAQCQRVPGGVAACGNQFPVQVGHDGVAQFQYQVRGDAQSCGLTSLCVVAVTDGSGGRAIAYTLFDASAPDPASVRLTPGGPYRTGQQVVVELALLPPGAPVDVAFCGPKCSTGTRVIADQSGLAAATVVLGDQCDRGKRCVIAVTGLATRDLAEPLRFHAAPTATYDARRTITGLGIALLLIATAGLIIRRTNWQVPTEAATPALDAATL